MDSDLIQQEIDHEMRLRAARSMTSPFASGDDVWNAHRWMERRKPPAMRFAVSQ